MFPMSQEPMGPPAAQMGQPMGIGGMAMARPPQMPGVGPPNAIMALDGSMNPASGLAMSGDLGLFDTSPENNPILKAMLAYREMVGPALTAGITPPAPNSIMGMQ